MAGGDDLILKAIRHAAVAGGCSIWSRRDETCAAGLNKAANRHSALAGAALDKWLMSEGLQALAPAEPKFMG